MDVYLLAPLFQTLFSIVLLIMVLKGHFRSSVHRLFALYILGTAFWGAFIFAMRASPDLEHAYFWDKLIIPPAGFSSVVLYHFAVRYTATKIKRLLLPFLYSVCFIFIPLAGTDLVFSGMQIKPYGYAPIFGPVIVLWMLFSYIVFIMALALFIRCYRTCYRAELRNRAAYIIVGMLCSLVGSFFDALPLLGLPLYPGLVIGNIVFLILTTVAIVRYNLLDIRVVLRKGIAYFLISAFIAVPFIAIHLVSHFYLEEIAAATLAYVVLGIIWVILLPQFWGVVQQMVDRWFYRDRYNYLKALESFSRETYSLTDSDKISSNTVNLFAGALQISNVSLLQPLSPKGDFINAFSSNVNIPTSDVLFKRQSLLVKWLERSNRMLPHDEIELIPQLQGISFKEKEVLRRLDAKLIVPLTTLTTRTPWLSGVLILGPKLSEEPYTVEDKQLIYTLSSQIAVKLENAQLYNTTQQEVAERQEAEIELRRSQEDLRNLSTHLQSVREEERSGLAREIHDELGQILTALKMDLSWVGKRIPEKQELLFKKIEGMLQLVNVTIQTVKRISTELRPGLLDDLGLTAAVEWQAGEFQHRTGIQCKVSLGPDHIFLDREQSTAVFRIFQEALTNVTRHANATIVKVNLREKDGNLVLKVKDNGRGIKEKQITNSRSFGIIGMRERALTQGGEVKIRGIPGKGTVVTVSAPLNKERQI